MTSDLVTVPFTSRVVKLNSFISLVGTPQFFYIWQLISASLISPQLYDIINPFKVFPSTASPTPEAAADAENFNYFDQINLLPAEKSKTWHLSEEFFQNIKI